MEDQSFSGSLPSRSSRTSAGSASVSAKGGAPLKSSLKSAAAAVADGELPYVRVAFVESQYKPVLSYSAPLCLTFNILSVASKKRKLAFESSTKAAPKRTPAVKSNKARVEVEYEMEEEPERVPAQLRILAAQAAQANSRGGGGGGRTSRVLKR